jgi:hypothetical protein
MKKIVCTFSFLITLIGCNQQNQYRLYNPDLGDYLNIKNLNVQSDFDLSTEDSNLKFWKSNTGNPVIIDSGGSLLYGSNIYAFKSKIESDYLILWVTENEYVSDIRLYILDSDTITKIGSLPIRKVCNDCDDVVYPIDKLCISAHGNEIFIDPSISFEYNLGNDNWEKFSPGQIYFIADKNTRKLKYMKH